MDILEQILASLSQALRLPAEPVKSTASIENSMSPFNPSPTVSLPENQVRGEYDLGGCQVFRVIDQPNATKRYHQGCLGYRLSFAP